MWDSLKAKKSTVKLSKCIGISHSHTAILRYESEKNERLFYQNGFCVYKAKHFEGVIQCISFVWISGRFAEDATQIHWLWSFEVSDRFLCAFDCESHKKHIDYLQRLVCIVFEENSLFCCYFYII